MEIGFDYRAAMATALNAARAAEAASARMTTRAERAFEGALAGDGTDAQAAAERFRAAHRLHVEAQTEVAELEAALEDGAFREALAA